MDSNCYRSRCLWEPPQRYCPLCGGFGLRILILPHVIDGAGAFAHVKAGGESAR
jgi:hypothetical protein